jgi:RND family efflux transporter MFP subunit
MQPNVEEKKKRSLLNRLGILIRKILIFLIFLIFLIGIAYQYEKKREIKNQLSVSSSLPSVKVMLAKPERGDIPLTLPSFLVGYNVTPLLSRVDGYLKNFYVDIGDHVKKGQLLCEIEVPDVDAQLPPATASLDSLKAKLEIAKVTAERWARLYQQDPDAIPKEEVDQTAAAYQSAVADVEAAQKTIERLKILQNFKYVYAPFDGIITERNIDMGSLISIGNENLTQPYTTGYKALNQPLFQIASTEFLRAFVQVPQPYYPYIMDGMKAQVRVAEHPDAVFSGVIDRNAGALDPLARTLLTQVNIENKDNLLRPGLYAEVTFSFKPYANHFNIPIAAIIIRNGPPFVALLKDDNTVLMQEVRIGRDFGKSVLITQGIKENDQIILNPNFRIKEGVKVNILQPETKNEK